MNTWKNAELILTAAKALAEKRGVLRDYHELENIQLVPADINTYTHCDVALANWSEPSRYIEPTDGAAYGSRQNISDIMELTSKHLERHDIDCDWSDTYTFCDECGNMLRSEPDSYSFTRSYALIGEGTILCKDCIASDPDHVLDYYIGDPRKALLRDLGIDLTEQGFTQVLADLHHGFHEGMDADPTVIAKQLEHLNIRRFIFTIDEVSQFYSTFSLWVDTEEANDIEWDTITTDGPSVSGALKTALQSIPTTTAPGSTQLAQCHPDGTATVRVLTHDQIQRCPSLIRSAEHYNKDGSCKCPQP